MWCVGVTGVQMLMCLSCVCENMRRQNIGLSMRPVHVPIVFFVGEMVLRTLKSTPSHEFGEFSVLFILKNPQITKIVKMSIFDPKKLIFSKFSQLYGALLLRVLRIERRAMAKNEALDEFC